MDNSDAAPDFTYVEKALLSGSGEEREKRFWRDGRLKALLPEIYLLENIPQPPVHHPEGDALTHTLLGLRYLPDEPDPCLAWGVLMHDVGKLVTTKEVRGRIRSVGHDRHGADLAEKILHRLGMPEKTRRTIVWLVRHHMFLLSWQVSEMEQLTRRQWQFLEDPRFSLLLDLVQIDTLASGANPGKLEQVDLLRCALRQLAGDERAKW